MLATATALHRVRGFVPEALLVFGIFYVFAMGGLCVQAGWNIALALLHHL